MKPITAFPGVTRLRTSGGSGSGPYRTQRTWLALRRAADNVWFTWRLLISGPGTHPRLRAQTPRPARARPRRLSTVHRWQSVPRQQPRPAKRQFRVVVRRSGCRPYRWRRRRPDYCPPSRDNRLWDRLLTRVRVSFLGRQIATGVSHQPDAGSRASGRSSCQQDADSLIAGFRATSRAPGPSLAWHRS
jgi:hypothetical protein